MSVLKSIVLCCAVLLISSCTDEAVKGLRNKLSSDYTSADDLVPSNQIALLKYRDVELAENKYFVSRIDDVIQNSFEKQISSFEDTELGFFKGYKYMAYRLLRGKEHNRDFWRVKTKLYFSNLDIRQDVYEAFLQYNERVKQLRMSYLKDAGTIASSDIVLDELHLPEEDISLTAFEQYSLNNILIEFGSDIAGWLLVLALGGLLSLFGTVKSSESKVKFTSAMSFIIILLISIVLTWRNDKKMIDSIRVQGKEINTVNFNSILSKLNDNTIEFYEACLH